MQFFYSATNGSDTGSVVAAVVGNEATANLSDLLPATTYTVYGVVTATNGSTPQSSSTTFTTEGARTDHAAWYELPARTTADATITQTVYPASGSQRNYTMYYDKSTYTAYWVAYPLAKGHMGNGRFRQMAAQSRTGRIRTDQRLVEQLRGQSRSYHIGRI